MSGKPMRGAARGLERNWLRRGGRMETGKSAVGRWRLVVGGVFVVGVYVVCRPLPAPFDLIIPVVVGVGLGSAIGAQRKGR